MKTTTKILTRQSVAYLAMSLFGFLNLTAQTVSTDGGSFAILNEGVSINGATITSGYNFASDLFGSMHIQGKDADHFFHIDVNQPDAASMGGTGDILHFYHRKTEKPYSIYAKDYSIVFNTQSTSTQKRTRSKKINSLDLLESLHAIGTSGQANSKAPQRLRSIDSTIGGNTDNAPAFVISPDELKAICPTAVMEFEGETYVNYAAIVPLLISSLRDIEDACEAQEQQIATLRQRITEAKAMKKTTYINSVTPNPATAEVRVTYTAGNADATSVSVVLSPVGGGQSTAFSANPAEGFVEFSIASLPAGHYVVSLVIDGSVVDTARLIHN